MSKTVKVAQTSDLSPGTGKVVQADGRNIALFNVEGAFFAIDNACTHRGGPLGEGKSARTLLSVPGIARTSTSRPGLSLAGQHRQACGVFWSKSKGTTCS